MGMKGAEKESWGAEKMGLIKIMVGVGLLAYNFQSLEVAYVSVPTSPSS